MLDAECRMAFLAVLPSSFTFFFIETPYTMDVKLIHWGKHHGVSENNQAGGSNSHPGWKCYTEVNHIFFVWSGLIAQWYPKDKTVIFIFLLGDIVGSVTWVGTLVLQLLFEENWLCPGLWEIFINMEDCAWAHLTFSKRSWLCEKENCLGVVKNDL